ncbi:hypothetical protein E4U43_008030 [Claviceps pusilla]|uniref:Cyclopropane-fatty-acyl-phospholipid synthase n=1 Tax=Claviceps pusilla TaxID=123648 RepID=A0A9P7T127_9HYPO|nr:hypothetical protein E4U43_008030 [Claviceps pusilla]
MDGVFQGSPWLPIIYSIDVADRALHTCPSLVATLAIVAVYYFFMASWPDVLLNACFFGLKRRALLAALARQLWTQVYAAVLPCAVAIGAAFLMLSTLNRNYSYLVVGIPVGISGNFNGMISVSNEQDRGFKAFLFKILGGAWYNVNAFDYLQRGMSDAGFRGKLDTYLRSQAVDPDDYPHAYLVTAARFLGYHFNPISLWYLYSSDRILSAIVLEVNNTFDERRPYLVLRDFSNDAGRLSGLTPDGAPAPAPAHRIKGSWAKDFHVSPFNSIKGTYSLLASDPLHPGTGEFRSLDVTINLSSSKGHAKLIARLFSDGEAVKPETMSVTEKVQFLSSWFWVGFVTFPRIVKEAAVLFFKRKLHVWYRPEPLKESLGRHATAAERALEPAFRSYLRFLIGQCRKPLVVRYMSSGITDSVEEVLASPSCTDSNTDSQTLQLKVLTPCFYTRFVHYAHDFEAIFTEMTDSGTIWTDQPHLLPEIFLKKASPPLHAASAIDYIVFKGIQHLRRRPSPIPRVSTSADQPPAKTRAVVEDIRDFRISSMDAYILEHADSKLKALYRSTLLRVLAADNYFSGSLDLLSIVLFVFRSGLAWFSVTTFCQAIDT